MNMIASTAAVAVAVPAIASTGVNVRPASVADIDPIFARIEEYRAASQALEAARSEHARREGVLIEKGFGLGPLIAVLEMREELHSNHPVLVYKHENIDIHIPPDRFGELNAAAHAELEAKFEQRKAILGDSQDSMFAAIDIKDEALDAVVWTTPNSVAGLLAMLEFLRTENETGEEMTVDNAEAALVSIEAAVRTLLGSPTDLVL